MKILIGDDHSVVRRGLKMIILEEYPNAIIQEAVDGGDLLNLLHKDANWDLIISDISMPIINGLEIIKIAKEQFPKIPVLILSMHAAQDYAVRTLKSGAYGYITKQSASDELIKAIQSITAGKKYVTQDIVDLLVEENTNSSDTDLLHKQLSNREFEVLKMLAEGKKISEIASFLSLSINTISTYRTRILEKMHFKSNADITKYALEKGLIYTEL